MTIKPSFASSIALGIMSSSTFVTVMLPCESWLIAELAERRYTDSRPRIN